MSYEFMFALEEPPENVVMAGSEKRAQNEAPAVH